MGAETALPQAGRGAAGGPGCEMVSVGLHLTGAWRPHVLVSKCLRVRLVWAGQRASCALHSSSPGGDPQATCNSPGRGLRPTSAPPGSAWHVPSLLWALAAPTMTGRWASWGPNPPLAWDPGGRGCWAAEGHGDQAAGPTGPGHKAGRGGWCRAGLGQGCRVGTEEGAVDSGRAMRTYLSGPQV